MTTTVCVHLDGTQQSVDGGDVACTAIAVTLAIAHNLGGDVTAQHTYTAALRGGARLFQIVNAYRRATAAAERHVALKARAATTTSAANNAGVMRWMLAVYSNGATDSTCAQEMTDTLAEAAAVYWPEVSEAWRCSMTVELARSTEHVATESRRVYADAIANHYADVMHYADAFEVFQEITECLKCGQALGVVPHSIRNDEPETASLEVIVSASLGAASKRIYLWSVVNDLNRDLPDYASLAAGLDALYEYVQQCATPITNRDFAAGVAVHVPERYRQCVATVDADTLKRIVATSTNELSVSALDDVRREVVDAGVDALMLTARDIVDALMVQHKPLLAMWVNAQRRALDTPLPPWQYTGDVRPVTNTALTLPDCDFVGRLTIDELMAAMESVAARTLRRRASVLITSHGHTTSVHVDVGGAEACYTYIDTLGNYEPVVIVCHSLGAAVRVVYNTFKERHSVLSIVFIVDMPGATM